MAFNSFHLTDPEKYSTIFVNSLPSYPSLARSQPIIDPAGYRTMNLHSDFQRDQYHANIQSHSSTLVQSYPENSSYIRWDDSNYSAPIAGSGSRSAPRSTSSGPMTISMASNSRLPRYSAAPLPPATIVMPRREKYSSPPRDPELSFAKPTSRVTGSKTAERSSPEQPKYVEVSSLSSSFRRVDKFKVRRTYRSSRYAS